jgi:hypothetical protein
MAFLAAVAAGMVVLQTNLLTKIVTLVVVAQVILVAFPMVPQLMVYNLEMEELLFLGILLYSKIT